MQQHIIKLCFEREQKRSAEFYRGAIARLTGKTLPQSLFWRNEKGHTITETPEIRWVKSHQGVSIVASELYKDELFENASALMAAFLDTDMHDFKVQKLERDVSAEEVDDILYYRADRLLFDKSKGKVTEFREANKSEQTLLLQEYLRAELVREAEAWDVDESVFLDNANHIRVAQVQQLAPAQLRAKGTQEAKRMVARYSIIFSMPVKLRGVWQVGRQRSKGYGIVAPYKGSF